MAQTLKQRWHTLDTKRRGHLERQRACAALTLPALLPPDGVSENDQLETPFQSLGARGVNNLSSKLLMTLLPPNSPFFRLVVSQKIEDELRTAGDETAITKLEKSLSAMERATVRHIEKSGFRAPLYRALRLLVATGNALIYIPDSGSMKVYRLDQYVTRRDPKGDVVEMLIREEVDPEVLPDHIKKLAPQPTTQEQPIENIAELFTRVVRAGTVWEVSQEVTFSSVKQDVTPVSATVTDPVTFPLDSCPWIALRWSDADGEHYGRGLVDENYGDLKSLNDLTEAIVEGSAASAKVLFLVNPAGMTDWRDLAQTPNLGFVVGRPEDVQALQVQKHADLQVANTARSEMIERLSHAFLLNSSVQRDAERVTAEEIRYMAQELEDAFGGVYSLLSIELQKPLIKRTMARMQRKGELPHLPQDTVEPVIVTGMDALGRGHDLRKLEAFMQLISPLGPEVIASRLDVGDYMDRCGMGLGLDTTGLIMSEEKVAQQQQQQLLQQLIGQITPDIISQLTGGAVAQAQQPAAPAPPPA
jgi:hypothetical protein